MAGATWLSIYRPGLGLQLSMGRGVFLHTVVAYNMNYFPTTENYFNYSVGMGFPLKRVRKPAAPLSLPLTDHNVSSDSTLHLTTKVDTVSKSELTKEDMLARGVTNINISVQPYTVDKGEIKPIRREDSLQGIALKNSFQPDSINSLKAQAVLLDSKAAKKADSANSQQSFIQGTPAASVKQVDTSGEAGNNPKRVPGYIIPPVIDRPLVDRPLVNREIQERMVGDSLSKLKGKLLATGRRIVFAEGRDSILPGSFAVIDEVIAILQRNPSIRLNIEGNTDNRGSMSWNMALSLKRAIAVAQYIITNGGIDKSRLRAEGYGPGKPIADNNTESGRRINRRIDLKIVN